MNYNEKIDPIGESEIDHQEEETDVLHELTCNIFTDIDRLKKEVENFTNEIEGFETYSHNTLFLNILKMQRNRLKSLINDIDTNFDKFNNLTS